MKFATVRLRFPDEPLSPAQAALARCDDVDLVQLRFGGTSVTGPRTYVFTLEGDPDEAAAALAATDGVIDHELVVEEDDYALAYLRAEASEVELAVHATFTQGGLVTTTPVTLYPDGTVVFRVLGDPDDLQAAVDEAGDRFAVHVERVGDYDRPPERVAAALTDRQREAVRAALDAGYYDVPRRATHEAVAAELDCAPATAAEHLQKAEAALVRSLFG
jgi:predicted DNA binding protein